MGRAIDMEKDIHELKIDVKKLEDIVRGMTHEMDGLSEKSTKTTHIDLVDDVKVEEDSDNGKKADNKTSSKSSGRTKKSNGSSKSKNNKHGNSDK